MKNYYQTLELSTDATSDEIKKSYRLFVSKFHPDKHNGDEFFHNRFLEIQEAYDILSDYHKRREYDSYLMGKGYEEDNSKSNITEPNVSLMVSNRNIRFGKTVKFVWETENVSNLEILGHGNYPVNGSVEFTPTKNTNYVFLFSNSNTSVKKESFVTVKKDSSSFWGVVIGIVFLIIIYLFSN